MANSIEYLEKKYDWTKGQLIDIDFEKAKEMFEKEIKQAFIAGQMQSKITASEYYKIIFKSK